MAIKISLMVIFSSLFLIPLCCCNGYGYGGSGNAYNPYNPYPYPYPYPVPSKPNPNPNVNSGTVVAFAFTRARKNNQCLNLNMCFIQFDNEVTKINAVTYPSYGAFQASVPGLYFFSFTLALGGGVQPRVSLRRNNDIIAAVNASIQSSSSTEHMPVTYSILLQLKTEDAVYIVVESGDVVENQNPSDGPLNSFSGYLVAVINSNVSTGNPGTSGSNFFSGSPGTPGFASNPIRGVNFGAHGVSPMGNTFPTNLNGMPPFQIGRSDTDPEIEPEDMIA